MEAKLQNFNHWKKEKDKVSISAPRTVSDVLNGTRSKILSQDCQPLPCTCTGCSAWD